MMTGFVGTQVVYRGRCYTLTGEPTLVDADAGVVEVVNSRGQSNTLFIAVEHHRIVRAATLHEPWAAVETTQPS